MYGRLTEDSATVGMECVDGGNECHRIAPSLLRLECSGGCIHSAFRPPAVRIDRGVTVALVIPPYLGWGRQR